MKKIILSALSLALLAPGIVTAAGYAVKGNVQVYESGTRQYMQATMNVRYNTTASGTPYVLASGYLNNTVSFSGRGSDGNYFSCYFPTSASNYQAAVDAKNNLKNGSRLYIYKQIGSSICENLSLGNYSYYLD